MLQLKIEYQKLVLRHAMPEDAETLCRWWNDGAVMAHAGFPNGLGTTVEKVARQIAADTDDTCRRLMIAYDGERIGEMSYRNKGEQTAEIGIKICEASMREKGLGTLCLKMLITRLFQMGYRKIILDTNLNNLRAQHVYEKLGFAKLRVNQNAWQDQLGVWQSSVDYALTPECFVPLSM